MVQNIKKQRSRSPEEGARIVCVTSGKGGVGKTNFTVNLALSLCRKGLRVLIFDADFGLANVDVVMGISPEKDLSHVIRHQISIRDVICEGPHGLKLIFGGSGVRELLDLSDTQIASITEQLAELDEITDIILVDTGAGITPQILKLASACREIVVVTTPEPTAIMDAYALVKTVSGKTQDTKIRLVVNKADSITEAQNTIHSFAAAVRLYLNVELETIGYIQSDPAVSKAVKMQKPFVLAFPRCQASKDIDQITWSFMNAQPQEPSSGWKGFLENLGKKSVKE
jgi:flagellar biosynthesis protein FlhG